MASSLDMDLRRNTAAQYFIDEDETEPEDNTDRRIIELLNEAAIGTDKVKIENLYKVQEMILNKCPNLLDNFLEEIVGFQTDRSADVRKAVVAFIEEASKKEPDILHRIVGNLVMFLQDNSVQVQKRAIQATSHVYRAVLMWVSKSRTVTTSVEHTWNLINQAKALITQMVDHDNDGIRTQAVKFLETVVLLQTYPEPESLRRDNDFSLDDVPMALKIARRRKLEEEAIMTLDLLIKFHGSPHISSVNLMACMGSLTLIAKMRPQYMTKVVTAMETLHTNLPPTLSKSQVSSVRKHLKLQLLTLLKHPASADVHSNITTLLMDLGATQQEIVKNSPKPEEVRKRQKRLEALALSQPPVKRPRVEIGEPSVVPAIADGSIGNLDSDVDRLELFIADRLAPDIAAQLVMQAMSFLPTKMPATFSASYTPIAAAGTQAQIRHVARLMATQFSMAGFGPDCTRVMRTQTAVFNQRLLEDDDEDDEIELPRKVHVEPEPFRAITPPRPVPAPVPAPSRSKPRIKTLKLAEITQPLSTLSCSNMIKATVHRILKAEKFVATGGGIPVRNKILTTLASQFSKEVREAIMTYILEDVKGRAELAFQWLYEEYSFMQGFNQNKSLLRKDDSPNSTHRSYNKLLCGLVITLLNQNEPSKERDALLWRIYLESPLITEEATELLKDQCSDESRAPSCLALLQQLVIRRPPRQLNFLNCILVYTSHENIQIRTRALNSVSELYKRGELRSIVEEYAILYLGFLKHSNPPEVLFGDELGRIKQEKEWIENTVKACLYLYLMLLPLNETLIHELARVYVQTNADVKRTILRLLEQPVRGMGMESPQLLKLVEDCPKGAETLVTRVIHILTEKTPPSTELVARVRDLYHSRVSDVRFLIPVLTGLSKKEVIAALPKLIKLNPVVVKEVFNRLLGTHSEGSNYTSPITPAELLVALHNIDPSKADMKTIIKATSLCFAEQHVYTQEVLAVVMQNLMEQSPLPVLLMRTVIQSLSLYPRLIGFIMNILQRLITKQVWKQKKVWEGFVKCCQRTTPQSFQVLLQLPAPQLEDVFKICRELHQPLLEHVLSFTENQRAHIPQAIMDVMLGGVQIKAEPVGDPIISQPGPPGDD